MPNSDRNPSGNSKIVCAVSGIVRSSSTAYLPPMQQIDVGATAFISQRIMSSEWTPLLEIWQQYSFHQRNLYGAMVARNGRLGRGPSHMFQSRSVGGAVGGGFADTRRDTCCCDDSCASP